MDNNKNLIYSISIHLLLIIFIIVGAPSCAKRDFPEDIAISMEILPLSAISNVKPVKQVSPPKIDKKETPPTPKESIKTPPSPAEKPKDSPKSVQNPENNKSDVKLPAPEVIEKSKENNKKDLKSKNQKKENDKNKKDDVDFDSLLKNLDEQTAKKSKEKKPEKPKEDTKLQDELEEELNNLSDGKHDEALPLSLSERDLIINQIYKCWNVPIGAKDIENLKVVLKINLQLDGNVSNVKILNEGKGIGTNENSHRILAESAVRAVHKCSPIKGLPTNKYESWKELELVFNPSDLLY